MQMIASKKLVILIILLNVIYLEKFVYALELNIEDQYKLTRVMAEVKDPQTVLVLTDLELESIELENIEGIISNIYPYSSVAKEYIFYDVSPGNWKVQLKPKNAKILSIKLQKE
jgi:hypothetical protein